MSTATGSPVPKGNRTFLVVVDETEEMRVALRYASRRAKATGGRVALLYVIDPSEFEHFMGVREIMREEKRQEAEETGEPSEECACWCSRSAAGSRSRSAMPSGAERSRCDDGHLHDRDRGTEIGRAHV